MTSLCRSTVTPSIIAGAIAVSAPTKRSCDARIAPRSSFAALPPLIAFAQYADQSARYSTRAEPSGAARMQSSVSTSAPSVGETLGGGAKTAHDGRSAEMLAAPRRSGGARATFGSAIHSWMRLRMPFASASVSKCERTCRDVRAVVVLLS